MELARTFLMLLSIPFVAALLAAPAALLYWLGTLLYRLFPSPYFAVYLVALAYLGFTPLLMLEAVALKRLSGLRIREGVYNLRDLSALPWALVTLLVQLVRYVGNLGLYRSTPFLVWYMRGMGAKVGKSVIVNTVKIYDMDLLEIGDRVTIGGDVVLIAHSGEQGRLRLKKVTIGGGADIGHSTTILGGAAIGENARIGAMSIVPKDAVIPPNTCWGGVPLREIPQDLPAPPARAEHLSAGGARPHRQAQTGRAERAARAPRAGGGGRQGRPVPSTILVTGGAGYLGSLLCRRLLDEGHRVRCLDLLLYGERGVKALAGHDCFRLWRADLSDEARVREALAGTDAVVHLAGLTNDASCDLDPDYARYVNLHLSIELYRSALRAGVTTFVNASSCAVYAGCSNAPADEAASPAPLSLYGRLQLEREEALDRQREGALVHLRLATLHGLSPRMRLDLPLNRLLYHAVRYGEMEVWGGENLRPLLHVADAAEAIVLVLRAAPSEAVVLNVAGEGGGETIHRMAEAVVRHVPARIKARSQPDSRSYAVRAERIGRLGFVPRRTLDESIQEMLRWLRRQSLEELEDHRLHNLKALARRRQAEVLS